MMCEGPVDLSILDLYCLESTYYGMTGLINTPRLQLDKRRMYSYYQGGIIMRDHIGTDNAALVLTDCRKGSFCEWRVSVKVNNEWNHDYVYFSNDIEVASILNVMIHYKHAGAIHYQRNQKIDSLLE